MNRQSTQQIRAITLELLLSWLLLTARPAYANTHPASIRAAAAPLLQTSCTLPATVTTANQLRDCITAANNNGAALDTITLGADITLTSALPQITTAITLEGAGYAIDGGNSIQLFNVGTAGDLMVKQATLQNGRSESGGGAIYNDGALTLINSTLAGNTATTSGGAIFNATVSTVTVVNSTFSDNTASNSGGAIYTVSTLILTNNTIAANTATEGSGIYLTSGQSYLAGNIFAGNATGNNCTRLFGTLNDNGYNLSDDATCTNGGTGSAINATLALGDLADNGGPTQTHLPGTGSDAIGAIPNGTTISNNGTIWACQASTLFVDQRGEPRPQTSSADCTAGAVEVATNSTTLTIIKDAGPAIGTDFDFTLTSEPFSNYSGSTSGNPFWTRPNEGGTCTLSTVSTRYHVQAFAVDTSGNYNLSSNQSGWDGYIHLYQDSFNPLAPCTHYLNGDDNVLSSGSSEISSQFLEAGRTYYFVTSGKFSSSAGNFSNSILGVGTVYTLYESFTLDDAVPDDSDGIDASTTFNVSPGTYAVTELPLSGWGLTGATCTGASGSVSLTDNTLSVEVSDGEAVQCTFTNESLCPASWIVTTAAELSVCITLANNNESPSPTADTITLGANITLSTALPQITSEITLEGAGYAVDGGNRGRIFFVNSTGDFTVNQVTLQNGSAYEGGGIYNSGTLTVSNSTISGNTGGRAGGGIYNINGTLTVSNSTISGNTAGSYGGGIYNQGSLTMNNSTLANNGAFVGGGIANFGTIYLAGNIFATNGDECAGSRSAIYDNGYNLSVSRLCTNGGPGSVTNATLNLGALADNGGPTLTHLPGAGSDAIGAIPNGTTISNNGTSWTCDQSATDQRGVLRPITAGTACTAGAVEVAISICPSWTATTADELYQCIFRANNNESPSPTADTITLGADITLSTALPQITSEITVEGAGYAVDGGGSVQLFFVALDGDFTINQATLQNGTAIAGGGIFNRGALIVTNSTFSGNLADIYGGGIYNIGTLTVTNSTFSGNSAVFGGGIANFDANTVMVTSSTFSGNSATVGDGIFTENTVVYIAGNIFEAGASGNNCANFGTLNDNGYNLSDDGTCGFTGTGSANNATLNLSALSGGVHTPQAGSDAIGAIPNGTTISNNGTSWICDQSATDQRGESRPINSGEDCTAGAVEVARVQLTLQPNGYFSWLPDRSGSCSESLYRSSTPYVGHTWLTDDPANYDGSGSLTSVAINYFYYLLVDCGGSLSQSNEVGEFTFAIVPGG